MFVLSVIRCKKYELVDSFWTVALKNDKQTGWTLAVLPR